MKYNYIFIFEDIAYKKIQYNDLTDSPNAQFIPLKINLWKKEDRNLTGLLCHIHLSPRINRIISIPFKNIWINRVFNFKLKDNLDKSVPCCFIIYALCYEKYENFLIKYLRNNYKECKIILFYVDLFANSRFKFKKAKHLFDAIFSFEKNDADKHGFIYYDNPYSAIDITSTLPKSDVFFIGKNKNRLKTILAIYELLTKNGIICDFIITDVDKKEQILKENIYYTDFMDYKDVINHVLSTKCILEILQDKAANPTLRSLEAVCYNKKLLTNCDDIVNKEYYNSEYISIFNDIENIDINFLKNEIKTIDYNYRQKVSPLEMIKHIDENINTYFNN